MSFYFRLGCRKESNIGGTRTSEQNNPRKDEKMGVRSGVLSGRLTSNYSKDPEEGASRHLRTHEFFRQDLRLRLMGMASQRLSVNWQS
jgi:hypothetical protein